MNTFVLLDEKKKKTEQYTNQLATILAYKLYWILQFSKQERVWLKIRYKFPGFMFVHQVLKKQSEYYNLQTKKDEKVKKKTYIKKEDGTTEINNLRVGRIVEIFQS